jgi:sorting nexin-29
VAYKIFTNILNERLKPWAEKTLLNYQCGFRPGKSMSNQIFTTRQMLENMLEHYTETYHLFVDFRTAYDSIIREKLYEAMQEFKFSRKLTKLTEMTMGKTICAIKVGNETSDTFITYKGLRQGELGHTDQHKEQYTRRNTETNSSSK